MKVLESLNGGWRRGRFGSRRRRRKGHPPRRSAPSSEGGRTTAVLLRQLWAGDSGQRHLRARSCPGRLAGRRVREGGDEAAERQHTSSRGSEHRQRPRGSSSTEHRAENKIVGIEVPTDTRRGEPGGIQAATAGARIKTDASLTRKRKAQSASRARSFSLRKRCFRSRKERGLNWWVHSSAEMTFVVSHFLPLVRSPGAGDCEENGAGSEATGPVNPPLFPWTFGEVIHLKSGPHHHTAPGAHQVRSCSKEATLEKPWTILPPRKS